MNQVSSKKLLNSKWTAVTPVDREKHFVVAEVVVQESGSVDFIVLEAIISRRPIQLDWRDLRDSQKWLQGWK